MYDRLGLLCNSLERFIRSFIARGQQCFALQKTIARYMKCSVRTVQRAIHALVARGELKVSRRGPYSAHYTLIAKPTPSPEAPPPPDLQLPLDFGGSSGASCGAPFDGSVGGSKPPGPITESLQSGESIESAPTALVCAPPQAQTGELPGLLRVFASFGRGCSQRDVERCESAWSKLHPQERSAALLYVRDSIPEWRSRPTDKILQPWNYLEGKYWQRGVRRIEPQREMSKREILKDLMRRKYGMFAESA